MSRGPVRGTLARRAGTRLSSQPRKIRAIFPQVGQFSLNIQTAYPNRRYFLDKKKRCLFQAWSFYVYPTLLDPGEFLLFTTILLVKLFSILPQGGHTSCLRVLLHCKIRVNDLPIPCLDVTNQTLPGQEFG